MGLGDYAAAYPNKNGAAAIFPLVPTAVDAVVNGRLLACNFGLRLPGRVVRKGETIRLAFLGVSPATSQEQGNEAFEEVRRALGLGVPPAYTTTVTAGRIADRAGFLRAEAADGAFAAKLSRTPMRVDLPVMVAGMNDRWTAARQVNGGRLKAITTANGVAYTNLDLSQADVSVAIGHPVVCDRPELPITVWWQKDGWQVRVHNPGTQQAAAVLRANPAFTGAPQGEKKVTVPAGTTVEVRMQEAWPANPPP